MQLCDYGCGQKAIYQFKNGKWRCSSNIMGCPVIKLKAVNNSKKAIQDKYGVDNASQIEGVSDKIKDTFIKRYGVSNASYLPDFESKRKMTNRKKLGVDYPMQSEEIKNKNVSYFQKKFGYDYPMQTPESRKQLSKNRKGKTWEEIFGIEKSNELKIKQKEFMERGHAVIMNKCISNPSKPQVELFNLCQELFPLAILNYPCIWTNRSIDIALPQLAVAIEYDGSHWHQDKEADNIRQKNIEEQGWNFVRYLDRIPSREELLADVLATL